MATFVPVSYTDVCRQQAHQLGAWKRKVSESTASRGRQALTSRDDGRETGGAGGSWHWRKPAGGAGPQWRAELQAATSCRLPVWLPRRSWGPVSSQPTPGEGSAVPGPHRPSCPGNRAAHSRTVAAFPDTHRSARPVFHKRVFQPGVPERLWGMGTPSHLKSKINMCVLPPGRIHSPTRLSTRPRSAGQALGTAEPALCRRVTGWAGLGTARLPFSRQRGSRSCGGSWCSGCTTEVLLKPQCQRHEHVTEAV